jgi:hypothetical protein
VRISGASELNTYLSLCLHPYLRLCLALSLLICPQRVLSTPFKLAEKQRFVLELGLLDVSHTKPNGDSWDFGIGSFTRPDLTVQVMLNQQEILKSQKCPNTFSCIFDDRSQPFELSSRSVLRVEVWDRDLQYNDLIDHFHIVLSDETRLEGAEFELTGKSTMNLSIRVIPE